MAVSKQKRAMAVSRRTRARRKTKAATRDVLGSFPRTERVPARWRRHYKRLIELREELQNRRVALTRDAQDQQPVFSTHMADAGTDTYDRDFALGMLSFEQDALYEIEQALNRI